MHMKKLMVVTLSCLTMLWSVPVYAGMRYYSPEEIQMKAREQLSVQQEGGVIQPYGSFYMENLIGYEENDSVNREAFEIAEFTFDTDGHIANDIMNVTYQGSESVSWEVGGGVSVSASDLFDMIEAEGHFDIAKSSTTSSAVGASKSYTIPPNKSGSIKIYAHGIELEGKLVYEWNDIEGNKGIRRETIDVLAPYKTYSNSKIHFGGIEYD